MPKTSEAQIRAVQNYKKKHQKQIIFEVNRDTEADILARLEAVPKRMTYIKDLIRKDIQEHPDLYDDLTK